MANWQVIVEKHGPAVWQSAYRLLGNGADASDCFQETFISALAVWRRQRVRNWPALLKRLATARALDCLRRRHARANRHQNPADWAAVPSKNPGPVQQALGVELAEQLRQVLTQLPTEQAQAFCLRHLEDFSYRQIARQLGITTNAVGVLLHRARARLGQLLGSEILEPER